MFVTITPDQMVSINNFSVSNPDMKIYKYTIGEFLNNLIGLKFNQPLDNINIDNIKNQNKIEGNQRNDELIEDN